MGYRLDNKEIDLSGLRQLKYVTNQKAGDVYRYKNSVIRIFRDGEEPISEETASYFTSVPTEKILLPRKLLFFNNAFKGYTLKLVPQRGSGKRIINTPKRELIRCVESLEKDVETLSNRRILLNGATPGYSLYNGDLYLVNPAAYSVLELADPDKLVELNQFQIHLLITELIASDLKKSKFPQSVVNRTREILKLRDLDQPSSDYLDELMQGQDNIKELVKKIS